MLLEKIFLKLGAESLTPELQENVKFMKKMLRNAVERLDWGYMTFGKLDSMHLPEAPNNHFVVRNEKEEELKEHERQLPSLQ